VQKPSKLSDRETDKRYSHSEFAAHITEVSKAKTPCILAWCL